MSIESTLNTILESAISNVYGVRAPQASKDIPYATFQKVSAGRIYSHDGYSKIAQPRYSIYCFAPTYDGAKVMAAAVTSAMEQGLPGSKLVGENDSELDGEYSVILDFLINYKEDI